MFIPLAAFASKYQRKERIEYYLCYVLAKPFKEKYFAEGFAYFFYFLSSSLTEFEHQKDKIFWCASHEGWNRN